MPIDLTLFYLGKSFEPDDPCLKIQHEKTPDPAIGPGGAPGIVLPPGITLPEGATLPSNVIDELRERQKHDKQDITVIRRVCTGTGSGIEESSMEMQCATTMITNC